MSAASQRELFLVPAPHTAGGAQTFLAPAQPALVSPLAAYPIDVVAPSQAYMPVMDIVENEQEGSSSWFAFSGALVAAAVAGVAIGRAGATTRVTRDDQLNEALVERELQTMAMAQDTISMLALMGEGEAGQETDAPAPAFNGLEYAKSLPGVTDRKSVV